MIQLFLKGGLLSPNPFSCTNANAPAPRCTYKNRCGVVLTQQLSLCIFSILRQLCSTSTNQLISMARKHTPHTAIEEGDQQNGAHFLHKKLLSSHRTIQQGHLYLILVQYLLHVYPLVYEHNGGTVGQLFIM
jgi:hypothetical protein